MAAQDGPWYRYAIDFALVTPAIVALAIGGMFQLRSGDRAGWFMATFALLALTGLSCVKYGISLRYAAFCDIPLIWLACTQVLFLSKRFSTARAAIFAASMLVTLCTIGLNQYMRIFVRGGLYDPITSQLVMKLDMYKSNEAVRAELASTKATLSRFRVAQPRFLFAKRRIPDGARQAEWRVRSLSGHTQLRLISAPPGQTR